MCHHITSVYRCTRCDYRIITDSITCNTIWHSRTGRGPCNNTNWTRVEDHSEKLCDQCAQSCGPKPVVLEQPRGAAHAEVHSPVLEPASVFGPFSELNAFTALYANARLGAWLRQHPERASGSGYGEGVGDKLADISRLGLGAGDGTTEGQTRGSSRGGQSGILQHRGPAVSTHLLFADVETLSQEEIDANGFEKQKVTGGIGPD